MEREEMQRAIDSYVRDRRTILSYFDEENLREEENIEIRTNCRFFFIDESRLVQWEIPGRGNQWQQGTVVDIVEKEHFTMVVVLVINGHKVVVFDNNLRERR
jgi:hypothetical protein